MSLVVRCQGCAKWFKAPETLAGKRVRCPKCGAPIDIPAAQPACEPDLVPIDEFGNPLGGLPAPQPGTSGSMGLASSPGQQSIGPGGARPKAKLSPLAIGVIAAMAGIGAVIVIGLVFPPAGVALAFAAMIAAGLTATINNRRMWRMMRQDLGLTASLNPATSLRYYIDNWDRLKKPILVNVIALAVFLVSIQMMQGLGAVNMWWRGAGRSSGTYRLADIQATPATFRPLHEMASRSADVTLSEVEVRGGGGPGQSGRLWVYLPAGDHPARSLPCILIAPAGTPLFCGMKLGPGDQDEHYPYAEAGFAVVAFELDGPLGDYDRPLPSEVRRAYEKFSAAGAGIVNARNAFRYATTQMPEVDPDRVYIAGHSSAATLALLFAEHQEGLAGCIAYAACSDVVGRMEEATGDLSPIVPGIGEFFRETSPLTHVDRLTCPTFLFHARDDSNVPVSDSERLADELRRRQRDVTLVTVPTGDHYDAMIDEGIGRAIEWVRARRPTGSPSRPAPPAPPPTVASSGAAASKGTVASKETTGQGISALAPPIGRRPDAGAPQTAQPTPKTLAPATPATRQSDSNGAATAAQRNPFPDRPGLQGIVRFQILGYNGSGDPQAVAEEALRGIFWADPTAVDVDLQTGTLAIGIRVMALNTGVAKAALQQAGFRIGGVTVSGAR